MNQKSIILLLLLALTCSCHPDKGSESPEGAHHHDESSVQFTLFSDGTEFFIEHEHLEAGQESHFLVHLTDLDSYKPLASVNVTILMDGVTSVSEHPLQPGIFQIPFTPERAGSFVAAFTCQSGSGIESVERTLVVFTHAEEQQGEEPDEQEGSPLHEKEGEITFLKEQAWKSDFMVSEVRPVPFASVIPTSGEILAMPGEKKSVTANGQGVVHFKDRKLVQGTPVTEGQHLFTLSSSTFLENNVELQYQDARNRYEKSRSEYQRHRELYSHGAISERQFITSRSNYRADSLRFHALAANASMDGLKVYAPISGTIHELNVSEGSYTETGQIMVVISSNRTLLLRADLSQQFYGRLKQIETANFRPAYADQVYTLEEMNGRLLSAGVTVAENDHYLPIIFELQNDGRLLEGAFAEVYLKTIRKDSCLVVPVTAISEEQGAQYVYVQVTGESYTKRAIEPGESDGRYVEILNGLEWGERVVTRGTMLVKSASLVTGAVGHGHSH